MPYLSTIAVADIAGLVLVKYIYKGRRVSFTGLVPHIYVSFII